MMGLQPILEWPHFSHVSIRDVLEGRSRSHEVKPDIEFARKNNIAVIRVEPGGIEIPAAVTIRTVVTKQTIVGRRIRDNWHVIIAPDSEALRRRLFAETNETRLEALDAPIPGMVAASYDAVKALKKAHEALSDLRPPRVGTYVEMTYAITREMTQPFITFRPSSVEVLRRARGWAKHHNQLAQSRWSAAHWPVTGPVHAFGLQIWPWSRIEPPNLVEEPTIPSGDPWEPGGELYTSIGDIVVDHFLEILESLWKAAFKQDNFVASQLTAAGYCLNTIHATRMGVGSMRKLMSRFHNSGHMTMMGNSDMFSVLGAENIRALTQQGSTNYFVEIDNDDKKKDGD